MIEDVDLREPVGRPQIRFVAPWQPGALIGLLTANVLLGIAILVFAQQAANENKVQSAVTWLCGAIGGLVASGIADGMWLARSRQAVQQRITLQDIHRAALLDEAAPLWVEVPDESDDAIGVHVPGTRRYHRPGCALAGRTGLRHGRRNALRDAGLEPCEVCEP